MYGEPHYAAGGQLRVAFPEKEGNARKRCILFEVNIPKTILQADKFVGEYAKCELFMKKTCIFS